MLEMMRDRDGEEFNRIFGEHADELIRVTTASGPPSRNTTSGRSNRVQPVGGHDLWEEPWLSRFREAGEHAPFQAAQNELANSIFIEPMLQYCQWCGLDTERAVCAVVDRAIHMGKGGARSWILEAISPIQSTQDRQNAIRSVIQAHNQANNTNLQSGVSEFQSLVPELTQDGKWGSFTHSALLYKLRQLSNPPLTIPDTATMLQSMETHASGRRFQRRIREIRQSQDLSDVALNLV